MNIKILAKKLGISITTVSRALGGYSDVSEKTREKVLKYARKYNYTPNLNASNLASRRSNIVGLVIPLYGLNSNRLNQASFFEFISGMNEVILKENYQFNLSFVNSQKDEKKMYEDLIHVQKVKKIILHNLKKNDQRINLLKKNNVDFVAWGRTQGKIDYKWVDLDNELSINLIMDYLIKKNHQKIAFVNTKEEYNFAFQRKQAFLNYLKNNNLEYNRNYYLSAFEDPEQVSKLIKKMLSSCPEITSIICSTEFSAAGAIKACNELGKKIGENISIITFDGYIVNSISSPSLTAVTHDRKVLGQNAIEILLSKNNKAEKNNFLAKPKIIERGSVYEIKKKA